MATLNPGLSESGLSEKVRPLFVVGCPRSGTTAFADYLNQHPEILVCRERYNKVPWARVTRDLFTYERILDFRPEETNQQPLGGLEGWMQYHAEIVAKKDPTKLMWVGDKIPNFFREMGLLSENNPGARFILLYRPIEEVAESTEARSRDPSDPWFYGKNAFAMALEAWNTSLKKVREFIESNPRPRVLIVSYRDFFYRNEAVVPLISRFLGLEFDESVTKAWREASGEFESDRRRKRELSEEQLSFIQEHADRAAEAWVVDRINRQTREPGLYVEASIEAALASLNDAEARAWRLQQRVKTLEYTSLPTQEVSAERLQQKINTLEHNLAQTRREARRARKETQLLKARERHLRKTKTWRLLDMLNRIRTNVLGKLRRES